MKLRFIQGDLLQDKEKASRPHAGAVSAVRLMWSACISACMN